MDTHESILDRAEQREICRSGIVWTGREPRDSSLPFERAQ